MQAIAKLTVAKLARVIAIALYGSIRWTPLSRPLIGKNKIVSLPYPLGFPISNGIVPKMRVRGHIRLQYVEERTKPKRESAREQYQAVLA